MNIISLPIPPATTDYDIGNSRMANNIQVTGSPGGAWNANINPTNKQAFAFFNDTDQTVTVKTTAGTGKVIAAAASAFLQCDGTNITYAALPISDSGAAIYDVNTLRIASAVVDDETITVNTDVYEFDTTVVPGITAGHIRIDVSGGSTAAATGTVASTDGTTQVADGDTVVVNGKTYTFQTSLTNVDGHVKIGADIDASLTNLSHAINLGTGSGTTYAAATTLNAYVTASAVASHVVTLTAKIPGTVGNAYTLTTNDAGNDAITLSGATLASGVDPTATEASAAFILAVSSSLYTATRVGNNETLITVTAATGNVAYACTETMAGSNNAFAAAATYGGAVAAGANVVVQKRVPLTQEVNLGNMHFAFPFTPIQVIVEVSVTSSGLTKLWDGKITTVAGAVTVDNSGSTDWATTDTVSVLAMG